MCNFFKTMLLHYFFRSVCQALCYCGGLFFFFSPLDDIFNSKMLLSSSNLRCFQLNKVSQTPLMFSIVAIKVKEEEDKNTQEVTVSLASLARLAWRLL